MVNCTIISYIFYLIVSIINNYYLISRTHFNTDRIDHDVGQYLLVTKNSDFSFDKFITNNSGKGIRIETRSIY